MSAIRSRMDCAGASPVRLNRMTTPQFSARRRIAKQNAPRIVGSVDTAAQPFSKSFCEVQTEDPDWQTRARSRGFRYAMVVGGMPPDLSGNGLLQLPWRCKVPPLESTNHNSADSNPNPLHRPCRIFEIAPAGASESTRVRA